MAYTLQDYDNTGDAYISAANSTIFIAQTFTASSAYDLPRVRLKLKRGSSNPGNITVELWGTSGGTPDGSALSISGAVSGLTTDLVWYSFDFSSPYSLTNGVLYALVLKGSTAAPVYWALESPSGYADGQKWRYVGSWGGQATSDCMFETYSGSTATYVDLTGTFGIAIGATGTLEISTAVELTGTFTVAIGATGTLTISGLPSGSGGIGDATKTRLVSIGNNRLYYEDA